MSHQVSHQIAGAESYEQLLGHIADAGYGVQVKMTNMTTRVIDGVETPITRLELKGAQDEVEALCAAFPAPDIAPSVTRAASATAKPSWRAKLGL